MPFFVLSTGWCICCLPQTQWQSDQIDMSRGERFVAFGLLWALLLGPLFCFFVLGLCWLQGLRWLLLLDFVPDSSCRLVFLSCLCDQE